MTDGRFDPFGPDLGDFNGTVDRELDMNDRFPFTQDDMNYVHLTPNLEWKIANLPDSPGCYLRARSSTWARRRT